MFKMRKNLNNYKVSIGIEFVVSRYSKKLIALFSTLIINVKLGMVKYIDLAANLCLKQINI